MAASVHDDDDAYDPIDRAARYWKKAAEMYKLACHADSEEVKKLYIQMAMSWATIANELEYSGLRTGHDGRRPIGRGTNALSR